MLGKCYIIPVEKACNADCTICISKSRNYNSGCQFLLIDDNFIENLKLLNRRGIRKFEITGGGEPFLNDELESIVKLVRYFVNDSYIKVYTNGNILKRVGNIDELDISVFHYDDEVNNTFMRVKNPVLLIKKLKFFREVYPNVKIRLSIPLHKGAIDSKFELDKMIDLTKKYVDEYVVRTLYPGCNGYEENYVDFDYSRRNVVFERLNGLEDFDSILLWSDGNLYTDWNIDKKRFLYSYMLLKPDSQIYVNEIERMINEFSLIVKKRILLEKFISHVSEVYESYNRGNEYESCIYNHLHNLSMLFGNNALVYLLDGDYIIEDLVKRTLELKKKIRDHYSFTHACGGYILRGEKLSHANLVHTPDTMSEFNNDLNILSESGRSIEEKEFMKVLRYRSFYL